MYHRPHKSALALVTIGLVQSVARAEPPRDSPDDQEPSATHEEVDLASDVIDPTASLLQMTLMYEWTIDHHAPEEAGLPEDDAHTLVLRPVIPFRAFGLEQIFRLTVPYALDSAHDVKGLDAVEAFDLVVFEQSWGRWGLGTVARLEPEGALAEETEEEDPFQLGPALGVMASEGPWTFGAFNQNLFSGDVQVSYLQPIIGYGISPVLSVSNGEMQIAWDWSGGEFESIPIGVQVNWVAFPLSQPIRLFANPELNLLDEAGSERWSVTFGLAVLASR